jgi:hypothetical protein
MSDKTSLLRRDLLLAIALLASGCASDARPDAMIAPVSPEVAVTAEPSPLRAAITVGAVTGGGETSPLWRSNVSNDSFRAALEQSLALHALAAAGQGRYLINADLALDRPLAGFEMTVTATVHYTVLSLTDQAVKLDEVVETPYTAHFSDSFLGTERLRLANEGAVRENIEAVIKRLVGAARPG